MQGLVVPVQMNRSYVCTMILQHEYQLHRVRFAGLVSYWSRKLFIPISYVWHVEAEVKLLVRFLDLTRNLTTDCDHG